MIMTIVLLIAFSAIIILGVAGLAIWRAAELAAGREFDGLKAPDGDVIDLLHAERMSYTDQFLAVRA